MNVLNEPPSFGDKYYEEKMHGGYNYFSIWLSAAFGVRRRRALVTLSDGIDCDEPWHGCDEMR